MESVSDFHLPSLMTGNYPQVSRDGIWKVDKSRPCTLLLRSKSPGRRCWCKFWLQADDFSSHRPRTSRIEHSDRQLSLLPSSLSTLTSSSVLLNFCVTVICVRTFCFAWSLAHDSRRIQHPGRWSAAHCVLRRSQACRRDCASARSAKSDSGSIAVVAHDGGLTSNCPGRSRSPRRDMQR